VEIFATKLRGEKESVCGERTRVDVPELGDSTFKSSGRDTIQLQN